MAEFLKKNPKFNMYTVDDLMRLGQLHDVEAIMELGIRVLEDELISIDDCPECDECLTEIVCPECDYEFDVE